MISKLKRKKNNYLSKFEMLREIQKQIQILKTVKNTTFHYELLIVITKSLIAQPGL